MSESHNVIARFQSTVRTQTRRRRRSHCRIINTRLSYIRYIIIIIQHNVIHYIYILWFTYSHTCTSRRNARLISIPVRRGEHYNNIIGERSPSDRGIRRHILVPVCRLPVVVLYYNNIHYILGTKNSKSCLNVREKPRAYIIISSIYVSNTSIILVYTYLGTCIILYRVVCESFATI